MLLACLDGTGMAQTHPSGSGVTLSPDSMELVRAEMREIAMGIQGVPLALATADWKAIQKTSTQIRASYILEKNLTPAQSLELEEALPESFKRLDAEFHQRAEKLGSAAAARNSEQVAFQFSRMLESCARCHSEFAPDRFPGFAPSVQQEHRH